MRIIVLLVIVCALGGYFQMGSPGSVIKSHDLRAIRDKATIKTGRIYCPHEFHRASLDSVADTVFAEAVKLGYRADELNRDATLDVIDSEAERILDDLEMKCAHIARMSDQMPVGAPRTFARKSEAQKKAEEEEKMRKFNKVLGTVSGATNSAMGFLTRR